MQPPNYEEAQVTTARLVLRDLDGFQADTEEEEEGECMIVDVPDAAGPSPRVEPLPELGWWGGLGKAAACEPSGRVVRAAVVFENARGVLPRSRYY